MNDLTNNNISEKSADYKQGWADGIDEFYEALTGKRCECCGKFREECVKGRTCFINEIADEVRGEDNESILYKEGYSRALRNVLNNLHDLWKEYERDPENVPEPNFTSAYALVTALIEKYKKYMEE